MEIKKLTLVNLDEKINQYREYLEDNGIETDYSFYEKNKYNCDYYVQEMSDNFVDNLDELGMYRYFSTLYNNYYMDNFMINYNIKDYDTFEEMASHCIYCHRVDEVYNNLKEIEVYIVLNYLKEKGLEYISEDNYFELIDELDAVHSDVLIRNLSIK